MSQKFRDSWYQKNKEYHLENVNARKHQVRDRARENVYSDLSSHLCMKCGESYPRELEFHCKYGKDKALNEMIAGGYPIASVQAEINKCGVLCANCQRKKTVDEKGWFRGKKTI